MINININGTVEKIVWKGERSCTFIIANDIGKLLGVITMSKLKLVDKVIEGQEYNFIGDIALHKRDSDTNTYYDNSFYVNDIDAIERI